MEAREAVTVAKAYFAELFSEGGTLEEVWFDPQDGSWCVTLGVKRPNNPAIGAGLGAVFAAVAYKVVRVRDKDGMPISIRNREGERAA
jgi:hypothetical protein